MKTALITGGSAGLGKITAETLAKKGYRVVIAARDLEKGERVVEEIKSASKDACHSSNGKSETISKPLAGASNAKEVGGSLHAGKNKRIATGL